MPGNGTAPDGDELKPDGDDVMPDGEEPGLTGNTA
jgi:hypothetical protein